MKALRSAPVLLCLLCSQELRAQISTDTCCTPKVRPAIPERASTWGLLRLTGSLGVAAQYRTDAADNKAFDKAGAMGAIAADYYFKRRFGLGLEAGFASYGIQPAYTQFFERAKALSGLTTGPTEQLAINNLYSFRLLAGPALSLRLRRLALTAAVRGGLFYNDAPVGSVYEQGSPQVLYRLSVNDKRVQLGGAASLGAYYALSNTLQLGIGVAAFASPITYTADNLLGRQYTFTRVLGGYSGFVSLGFTVRTRPVREQLPVVLPSCYAPVLASPEPVVYDVARQEMAVFKWKSGAPIYAVDEEFTIRIYALPSNKLLLERTTTEPQLSVPATAADLPKNTAQLYYTLQASRRDQAGQRCLSPVTTGNISLVRK
jgi:hypothetical protein